MPFPLLAGVTLPFLEEVVMLLAISVIIAYFCFRIRLVPIAGFLLAGVFIGPGALGLVDDVELVSSMAEVGVILLLFTIGLEFSLEKLSRIGYFIFSAGGLQVTFAIVLVVGLLLAFGVAWQAAVFTGFLVALSSTAIVLSLLSDRAETDTPTGQLSLAVLIFQDLAIVAMVLLVPLLAGTGGSMLFAVLALVQALVIVAAVLVLARKTIPWLLDRVAVTRRQELFLLAVVAICFGTAWITSLFGVSLALGAFLAGLVVSESRYSEHALSEILPLRTIFNALFFVSIGMLLDVRFFVEHLPVVLAVAAGVLLLKFVATSAAIVVIGYPFRVAAVVGVTLAQIGEFSFVLERAGSAAGLTPAGLAEAGEQTFIAVTVLLMLLTPILVQTAPRLARGLERTPLGRINRRREQPVPDVVRAMEDHVIVVGYGPAGRRLVHVLRETGIPFVILELNPRSVADAQAEGLPIFLGDSTRPHMLEHAGVERAKLCVVAINDLSATRRTVELARYLNPTLQIVVRTRFLADVEPMQRVGADTVVPEELETSIRLFTHVLGAYMIPPEEINRHVTAIRSGDYRIFRGSIHEAHLMVLQGLDEEGLHTRAVAVRPGAPAAGRTLSELALRQQHNLTVLAIRRGGRTIGSPAGDFRIEPGDRLVLVGTAQQFAQSAFLFREKKLELPEDDVP